MPVVKMPDGTNVAFPDDMPKEQIRDLIAKKFPDAVGGKTGKEPVDRYKGGIYGDGTGVLASVGRFLGASGDAAQSAATLGFNDEIAAGVMTGAGFLGDYSAKQKELDAGKKRLAEENPVASAIGSIGGGVALGGRLAQGGATLAGRSLPVIGRTGAAALEGAAYGGLYGAGDASQGERLSGAATGALTGGVTAGLLSKAGDKVASLAAKKATQRAVAAAPTAQALKQTEDQLFNAARSSGVQVKPAAADRLVQNMRFAAGRPNDKIRPATAGLIDDIMADPTKYTDIQGLHELRQQIGGLMNGASNDDARTLGAMKRILDNFIDNPNPAAFTGNKDGFNLLREGIQTSAKRFKAQEIEKLLDLADVVAEGNVTQSGIASALRTKAGQLYKRIVDGNVKGFSAEEVKMIRDLASRNTSSKAVKWLAKWSPSGPMATTLAAIVGGGSGAAVGGPVGAMVGAGAIMAPGAMARGAADKAAIAAGNTLRASSALGGLPQAAPGVNRLAKYATPAAITATQLLQPRSQSNGR